MNLDAHARPAQPTTPPDADVTREYPLTERRRSERVATKDLLCLLGEVLDLSENGAMIHYRGKLNRDVGDCFAALMRHEALSLAVSMKIARVEQVGYRRYNIGVEFLDLTEFQRSELRTIAAVSHDAYIGPQAYVA